ncbi:MAG: hypothetical protein R3A52_26800 [Polyangiales bacterium]
MSPEAHLSWSLAVFAALVLSAAWVLDASLRVASRQRRPRENRRRRLALTTTRVVALAPLVTVAASAWAIADPAPRAPRLPAPRGWPFDPAQVPVARVGPRFDYSDNTSGYQVGMRFDLSHDLVSEGRLVSAALELTARVRVVPDQVQGTEGIWVAGVLSGTTWPLFRVPGMSPEDLSYRNVAFTRAVFACCRERVGEVSLPLADLLRGARLTPEAALANDVLDVVIADDVEVLRATLRVCPEHNPNRCRPIAPQRMLTVAAPTRGR